MEKNVILAKSNEPPFMEITDLNPFAVSFPLFGTGDIYEEIKTIYIVAIDAPLVYYQLKVENLLPGFNVLFSIDKNVWYDKLIEKGNPYIIDGSGNYAYKPIYVKIRFHDTVDFNTIGSFKSMKLVLIYA